MLCLLDSALGEFSVADRDRDPHQLRIVLDIEGEQGEQLQAVGMAVSAKPVAGLVSFAPRHRMQRQIPGTVALDGWGAGTQHHLGDLRDLAGADVIAAMDLQFAQPDDVGSLPSDDPVGVLQAEAAFERHRRLRQLSFLQQLPSSPRLEHPHRPVLSALLGCGKTIVGNVKRLIEAVERYEVRRPEVVRYPFPGVVLAREPVSLSGSDDLKGPGDVRHLILKGGSGQLQREPANPLTTAAHGIAGLGVHQARLFRSPGHHQIVEQRGPE